MVRGGHITGVAVEQYPCLRGCAADVRCHGRHRAVRLLPRFQSRGASASRSAGGVPLPADYQTAVVPGVKAALGPAYPAALNPQAVKLRGVTQNISAASDRPSTRRSRRGAASCSRSA
jgi:hypothetical protein